MEATGISRKQLTTKKIIAMLREAEVDLAQGTKVGDMFRILGVSEQSEFRRCREYGGLKINSSKQIKNLVLEKKRLKKAVP